MDEHELEIDNIIFRVSKFLKMNPKDIEQWQLCDVLKYYAIHIEENEIDYYQYKKTMSGK